MLGGPRELGFSVSLLLNVGLSLCPHQVDVSGENWINLGSKHVEERRAAFRPGFLEPGFSKYFQD